MLHVNIIHAEQQAIQALRPSEETHKPDAGTLHGGMYGMLSWAYVTGDVYLPVHRQGAYELCLYILGQEHITGDTIQGLHRVREGDMLIMQAGASNYPLVKPVGAGFSAFEFWFTESGILQGGEVPDFLKIQANQFPRKIENDVLIREIFGGDAPVVHLNTLHILELIIPPGATYAFALGANRQAGVYVIKGAGRFGDDSFRTGDFIEIQQREFERIDIPFIADESGLAHLIIVDMKNTQTNTI